MRKVEVYVPVRIDLTGGATDISPFRDQVGGRILNMAVDLNEDPSVYVCASQIPENHVVLRADNGSLEEYIDSVIVFKQKEFLNLDEKF